MTAKQPIDDATGDESNAMTWYPNERQWRIIWIVYAIVALVKIDDWDRPDTLATLVIVGGALLVWRQSKGNARDLSKGRIAMSVGARLTADCTLHVAGQLLTQHSAKRCFERFAFGADVLPKGRINERLIAATASRMNLFAKPLQQVVVNADRDPRLVQR